MTQTLLPFAPERTPRNVDRSFAEIGLILGISKQHAQRLHDQGLAKIEAAWLAMEAEDGMTQKERSYPIGCHVLVREPGGKKWLLSKVVSHWPFQAEVIENDPVWRGAVLPEDGWRKVKATAAERGRVATQPPHDGVSEPGTAASGRDAGKA